MKIGLIIWALIFILPLSSCVSDEESVRQVNSAFKGEYAGTFSGDENGNISFTISKEGTMDGKLEFPPANTTEIIDGYVNSDGKFDMNTKNNFHFTGYLKQTHTTGSWKRGPLSGTFSFDKKQ
ncbi:MULTISPECIES: hypothetical protein [Chryseobacterium]|uniref:hypothetical protein n=1 Tax=Chryseobacterium TaxID=59732 RepID=UPI00129608BC|nr:MULTISPECIES: hypothetical protein [Chryseobacterium]MDR6923285.1 hypothetical protein [Chryseobacterium sp. 2987]